MAEQDRGMKIIECHTQRSPLAWGILQVLSAFMSGVHAYKSLFW